MIHRWEVKKIRKQIKIVEENDPAGKKRTDISEEMGQNGKLNVNHKI